MIETAGGTKRRDMPLWLGIAIVCLGLGGAGWFLWSQVSGFWSGPKGVFTIDGTAQPMRPQMVGGQPRMRPNRQRAMPAIRQTSPTTWVARVGLLTAILRVEKTQTRVFLSTYLAPQPKEAAELILARGRFNRDVEAKIGITPDQNALIARLPNLPVTITPDELAKLTATWQRYIAAQPADRAPIEVEITQQLTTLSQQYVPAAQQRFAAMVKSFSPQQWDQIRALTIAPPAPAPVTPKPAIAPAVPATAAPALPALPASPAPALPAAPN